MEPLETLMSGFFNQDFTLEFGEPEDVLVAFNTVTDRETVLAARQEIQALLLACPRDEDLLAVAEAEHWEYQPKGPGELRALLERAVAVFAEPPVIDPDELLTLFLSGYLVAERTDIWPEIEDVAREFLYNSDEKVALVRGATVDFLASHGDDEALVAAARARGWGGRPTTGELRSSLERAVAVWDAHLAKLPARSA
jgi:hypothetical protein